MRTREPAPGLPYHRATIPERGGFARLVAALGSAAVGFLAVTVAALLAVYFGAKLVGRPFELDAGTFNAGLLLATNLGLALLIPLAGLLTLLVYQVRFAWLSSLAPGLRRGWLSACVGMSFVVWAPLGVLTLVGAVVSRDSAVDSSVWAMVAIVVLTTPFQAAGEEYLFRGFLLQSLGAARVPAYLACLVSGLLFATAHLQFDVVLFADRLLIGFVFAYITIKTAGLEAAIALHAVKNLFALVPAVFLDDLNEAIDPQDVSWIPFVADVVMLAVVVPWILYAAFRRQERWLTDRPVAEASAERQHV